MVDLVYVIHVVEEVRGGGIQVERRTAALRRTSCGEMRRHSLAQLRLLHWVQSAHHRIAVGSADGVRTCAFVPVNVSKSANDTLGLGLRVIQCQVRDGKSLPDSTIMSLFVKPLRANIPVFWLTV